MRELREALDLSKMENCYLRKKLASRQGNGMIIVDEMDLLSESILNPVDPQLSRGVGKRSEGWKENM